MTFASGLSYVGEFLNNYRHGHGRIEVGSQVTERARAHNYYSVSTCRNSNFTLLAVQVWLYQCI